jgi:hypothetical protein
VILEKKMLHNKEKMNNEVKNNSYEFKMLTGKKVTYGMKIQLRHEFSGELLTLYTNKMSEEFGCV